MTLTYNKRKFTLKHSREAQKSSSGAKVSRNLGSRCSLVSVVLKYRTTNTKKHSFTTPFMTQDSSNDVGNVAEAYKQLTQAEQQASALEKMLDQLDAKMDSILKEAENIQQPSIIDPNSPLLADLEQSTPSKMDTDPK